ncbi:glycosyltransferase family 48 protein [[Candida] arabinofermentans NRRL YB-2248]|uniref:1,3-beta-glucan synthase n=1 Tax=[Candida] arabinofermentans NRRL YB-2248 TaxID=983967 RepID=A0A1E4SSZ9_9ASCO|nr:glycosyltransferase family 48 protein [[Candida] arabinofermentans NRRL YB-2248]
MPNRNYPPEILGSQYDPNARQIYYDTNQQIPEQYNWQYSQPPTTSQSIPNTIAKELLTLSEDPYYSWSCDEDAPITQNEISEIFQDLQTMFGFQKDSVNNMFDHFMVQLDSKTSRMPAPQALLLLHADYIGGEHSNYRKWYLSAQLEEDDELCQNSDPKSIKKLKRQKSLQDNSKFLPRDKVGIVEHNWRKRMYSYTTSDMVYQVALYLLIWSEANNLRFAPECLCFVYKCAFDHFTYHKSSSSASSSKVVHECDFLDRVITPLYEYIRDQQFKVVNDSYVRREKDHHQIIGYDDVNQFFWYYRHIKGLVLTDGRKLVSLPKEERYGQLGNVKWKKAFYKTYNERRSWWHLATNFNRIWVIHGSMFWYYSSFNSPTLYTQDYTQLLNNQPTLQSRFSVVALGSVISCLVQIFATVAEWAFVPRRWPGSKHLFRRLIVVIIVMIVNIAPSVFILGIVPLNSVSRLAHILSVIQFFISILTTIWFAFQPTGSLLESRKNSKIKCYDASNVFTASFPRLNSTGSTLSILLWLMVFSAKFAESYFFLTLSLRDPVRNLDIMDLSRCHGDSFLGSSLCRHQAKFVLCLIYLTDLVLFFLDTYLWYIIWNSVFSLCLAFFSGISSLSPWRNVFTRLPQRIYSKLLSTADMEVKYKSSMLISQVWNAIIISMYREHLLSIDHVHRLIYDQIPNESDGKTALRTPSFFLFQDDGTSVLLDFFVSNSEAERRISFFAQSLSTPIPEPIPVEAMPTFSVLIPHYSEKIILGLREIIREDPSSKISLLEYLKSMYPHEWDYFVRDTKILAHKKGEKITENAVKSEKDFIDNKVNDLPLYCIGYKSSAPEFTLRTRIWATLRTQTLYRTVSGFMNYQRAIKLLHKIENPEMMELFGGSSEANNYLTRVANRKFKLLVSMQRLQNFSADEKSDLKVLTTSYPDIYIASLEHELDEGGDQTKTKFFSVLYHAQKKDTDGNMKPLYRIRLSGDPILGDGKSDNQNHCLIFYRGEYIQVIDANQDNYIEECLKIRSVLSEFEELEYDNRNPYIPSIPNSGKAPVAIIGAREYIFSENTGVLGDVAAAKEQTFGTLFSRTLAEIGGKLHYGHPDFLNGTFMTTRGGISKAQRGLHLNEDIYAGMNALMRGGRIKHCDYYQCGKGRDLGFGSILNFTSKIGGGMGEQMLSREYYYLGTQLPLDRFLSFYYAHPGFHINNLFIILSLHLFMLVIINLGALNHESILCIYNKDIPITDLQIPIGCQNLQPVLDWVTRYVLSIFICFFISFLPLVLHELLERGIWKAFTRLFFHFLSLSPLFEVFVCQIYSNSLKSDIVFGGARYISTGRGFAMSRLSFSKLYSTYATTSIYSGVRLFLFLLFGTATMWQPAILWFWITLISLAFSPFIFNPHQFSRTDFFLDYRDFIRWLGRGNSKWHKNSWIGFTRFSRSKFTGFKRKIVGDNIEQVKYIPVNIHRAPFGNTFFAEVIVPFLQTICIFLAYTFINAQNGVKDAVEVNSVARLLIISFAPIILNAIVLTLVFPLSIFAGPLFGLCCNKVPTILAAFSHGCSVVIHLLTMEVIWILEGSNFNRFLCAFTCSISIQRTIFQTVKLLLLTREMKEDYTNRAWWSGQWINSGLGWLAITQSLREGIVKIVEMSLFAADFTIGHMILIAMTPILFIPYADHWHSCMLLWLAPSRQLKGPVYTTTQKRMRSRKAIKYAYLYFFILLVFACIIVAPIIVDYVILDRFEEMDLASRSHGLIQPNHQENNDTGPNAPDTILRAKPAVVTFDTYWI